MTRGFGFRSQPKDHRVQWPYTTNNAYEGHIPTGPWRVDTLPELQVNSCITWDRWVTCTCVHVMVINHYVWWQSSVLYDVNHLYCMMAINCTVWWQSTVLYDGNQLFCMMAINCSVWWQPTILYHSNQPSCSVAINRLDTCPIKK